MTATSRTVTFFRHRSRAYSRRPDGSGSAPPPGDSCEWPATLIDRLRRVQLIACRNVGRAPFSHGFIPSVDGTSCPQAAVLSAPEGIVDNVRGPAVGDQEARAVLRCVGRRAAGRTSSWSFSRRLIYVGLVFLPCCSYRVGKAFDLSDLFFLVAAVLLILSRRPPKKAPPAPAWYFGSFVWILAGVVASSQAVSKTASLQVVVNAIFVFFVLQWMLRQLLDTDRADPDRHDRLRPRARRSRPSSPFLQTEFHVLGYSHAGAAWRARAPSD